MEKIEGVNIRRRTIIINKEWRTEKGWEYLEREILTLGGDERKGKGDNNWRRKIFGQQRIRRPEKEKEQTI